MGTNEITGSKITASDLRTLERTRCWSELSADEKIERLREQIKSRDWRMNDLQQKMDKLLEHQHGTGGQLLAPINRHESCTGSAKMELESLGGVYF